MAVKLRVVDFNTWHGLSGQGIFKFGELEPKERRLKRYEIQIEKLKQLQPDLVFLQEMNPLFERSKRMAEALDMSWVSQLDQSGIKFLGCGIPWNLNTGLAILARKDFHLKKISGPQLSGSPGYIGDFSSFQVTEFRFALLAQVEIGGQKIQLANLHLHHGPVASEELSKKIERAEKEDENIIDHREEILASLKKSQTRRKQEVLYLLSFLEPGPQLVCGDFNVEPQDILLKDFRLKGLADIFSTTDFLTWNKNKNSENHKITRGLKLSTPTFGSQALTEALKDYDSRPRRIDYILASLHFKAQKLSLCMDEGALLPSDHFGLFAELNL